MNRTHAVAAIIGTAALSTALSQAIASPKTTASPTQGTRLKQPAAAAASVNGRRFVVGRYVTAATAASNFGVPPLVYATVRCPHGTRVISGGWDSSDLTNDPVSITSSEIIRGFAGWIVAAHDTSTDTSSPGFTFRATAVCG